MNPPAIEKRGPTSYQNWRSQIAGVPRAGASEVPFYSDAHITGELTDLGPYVLRNGIPADERDPAIVLMVDGHMDPNDLPPMDNTDTANFTGAWLGDEIAALCALAFGARVMAGNSTRILLDAERERWVLMGHRERPAFFPARRHRHRVLPRVVQTTAMRTELLSTFPGLSPEDATALVRAARSYRDALWIAEAEPELSWLMFVSALEVAAVQQHIDRTTPIEVLRVSKPRLVARLESLSPEAAEEVASALARELRATARFLDFMEGFMPEPPEKRPPEGFRLDWSPNSMKRFMKRVYEHRSLALHRGSRSRRRCAMGL